MVYNLPMKAAHPAEKSIKPHTKADKSKRLILLDSHAILHRAYHALPDFATAKGEPTGALYGLSAMLIKIIEDLRPDYIVACYDVKGPTYRHEAYKAYKAQRKEVDTDLIVQMNRSRDIFKCLDIPIYDKQGFEADDMLGTIVDQLKDKTGATGATGNKKSTAQEIEIIIASGDMDTLQLVDDDRVKVYTLKKGIQDTIMYDEDAVRARFGFGPELIPDYKGLRGDPSDNIIGVKGVGEKTATILITTFGTIENMFAELEKGHEQKFLDAGITPRIVQLLKDNKEEAEFSKMLATIRRDAPITFTMPEKMFRESLDVKKVTELWRELEFRTLVQRLQKAARRARRRQVPVQDTGLRRRQ
jgi:DNA polymerase-1